MSTIRRGIDYRPQAWLGGYIIPEHSEHVSLSEINLDWAVVCRLPIRIQALREQSFLLRRISSTKNKVWHMIGVKYGL